MLMRQGIGHVCPHCGGHKHTENCIVNLAEELRHFWEQGKSDRERGMQVVMNDDTPEGHAYNMGAACARAKQPA